MFVYMLLIPGGAGCGGCTAGAGCTGGCWLKKAGFTWGAGAPPTPERQHIHIYNIDIDWTATPINYI